MKFIERLNKWLKFVLLSLIFFYRRSSPNNSLCINVDPMEELMEEDNATGIATKRRGESFLLLDSAEDSGGEEGSPRLGKLRKCSHVKDFVLTTTSLQGMLASLICRNSYRGPKNMINIEVSFECDLEMGFVISNSSTRFMLG